MKIPKVEPLPSPGIKPLQTEEIQTTQIKSPDVTDFNYDIDNVKYTVTTESRNANISTNTSDGLSLNIERPNIEGYNLRQTAPNDLYHNFPKEFDAQIVKEGNWANRINEYRQYNNIGHWFEASGTVNGVIGFYQIGINQQGIIFHKNFLPLELWMKIKPIP